MEILTSSFNSPLGDITLFRIVNSRGCWVELSSLGAGILGVGVPDSHGTIENVALCYADPASYIGDGPNMGKCPGRYANRIANGHLRIDGKVYQLNCNLPPHHLHGGAGGFQNKIWDAEIVDDGVKFSLVSPDGQENYPGTLALSVTYLWNNENTLTVRFEASTDAPTVINLTNHTYWNLSGADSGSALGHEMKMKAAHFLETDDTLVPTGRLLPVEATPMDFTAFKPLGKEIECDYHPLKVGKGYDHCWAIDNWKPGRMSSEAVIIRDPESRRTLTIDSDQPGVQIYTGNWLDGCPLNKSGRSYSDYDGIAVEMQGFPDAPNHPEFPSQLLHPGEIYQRTIVFSFGIY